jgi:acetyl-CoA C-acetyltransferase
VSTPPAPAARTTPVVIGVGQVANKDDDLVVTPLELIADAIRRAADDSGAAVLDHVDGLFLSPPWNDGSPGAVEALAAALGLAPGERRTGTFSGSMPQELVAQACDAVADGSLQSVVVAGGVADASVRRAHHRGDDPVPRPSAFWTGEGRPPQAYLHTAETVAGIESAAMLFAIVESRLAFLAGRSPAEQRRWLGDVMAPFTRVAASHPELAWFPQERTPAELAEVDAGNRLVNEPYPKLMNSFPDVDLAGAVIVTSSELADRLGVPRDRRVHPWGAARCYESQPPSGRPEVHRSPALQAAVGTVLARCELDVDDLAHVDLYSCFPAAVQLGVAAFGLDLFDPRGLTTTGGLPYFGGPGAAYGFHAIAATVERCRTAPGHTGAVLGVGGQVAKFAAGIYNTEASPHAWCYDTCAEVEASLAREAVPVDVTGVGEAVVEAMTVSHHRDRGPIAAPVLARFADGRRTGARPADPALPSELAGSSLIGSTVRIIVRDGHPLYEIV